MSDTDPSRPPDSPPAAPPAAPTPRRRRWPLRLLASWSVYLAGTALMLALAIGPVWWLLFTADGARFVLARVPQLQAEGIAGSLLGGLSAERIELPLPGEDATLRLQGLQWTALRLRPGAGGVWLRIGIDELRARRVDLQPDSGPSKTSQAPTSLALPVGLDVGLLRIDEFHIAGLETPLRDLRARLALGADDGATHKVDALQLAWDKLRLTGSAQVATGGTLALEAALSLSQQPGAQGEWQAALKLTGPLATPQLQAQLRAQTAPARPVQTLDASATLRPFAAWPLGDLQASARALDLSALHSDAPRTALDLDASAVTEGRDLPAQIALTLANRDAGRWNEGRLPLRALTLQLKARPDDPSRLDVTAFDAELGSTRAAAGRLRGSGQWASRRLARRHPADRAAPGAGRCPRTRHAPRRPAAAGRQRLRCRHARCGAGQRARAARWQPARPGAGTAGAGAAGRAAERAAHRIARTAGAIGRGPGHAVGPGRAAHPQRRLGAHRTRHAARVRSAALVAGSRRLALAQGAAPAECRHRVRPGTAGSRRQRQHPAAAGPRARQRFAGRGAQPAGRRAAERHAVTGHWRRRPKPWPAAARCRRQPPAR